MHYNSSVAEHWTIFSYALYVVCMYFVSLIQLLLPNQINHYYYSYLLGPHCGEDRCKM